ncbi:MAG: hypothetical protein FWF84_00365 [Kiritimatiellaeota bacterium]|nr:hypothetical protein [Kiritimatiellota bacterium]
MNARDRGIIRRLAGEWMEEATRPIQRERVRLWTANNDLAPERPMVWITEIPWAEFEGKVDALKVESTDEHARWLEGFMRKRLFTARCLKTDEVLEPLWRVGVAISGWGYGVATSENQIEQGASPIQSHHYKPVIADFADIEKLKMPTIRFDREETLKWWHHYDTLFGDILPVAVTGVQMAGGFTAWDNLVRWTGVTEALMDIYDRPEFIHALMRRITDVALSQMDQLEAMNLLAVGNSGCRIGSGAAGYTSQLPRADREEDEIRLLDQWGFATAQIFSDVSPEMHQTFALDYENEILGKCGLNYYGCCEPLHNKMDILRTVPRLRKISVSAWCDIAQCAHRASQKYVFSHKPNPAMLAEDAFNAPRAEEDMRRRLRESGDMPCEFIMKDISTVRGDVQRVIDWCAIAYRVCTEGK